MACFSPVVNTRGAIFTHKDGIVLRPQYFVFQLYANLMKNDILDVWKYDVPTLSGKDGSISKTVDTIDIVVSYDNGEYAVAAINKDPENTHSFDLSFLDDKVNIMDIYTVNGENVDSYNDIGKTDVGIKTIKNIAFTGHIAIEPHSVNIILLKQ